MIHNLELWGIFAASFLGSWHCAGMCGPFVSMQKTKVFYHLGRLLTYSVLTAVFFVLSIPVKSLLGSWIIYAVVILWLVMGLMGKNYFAWQLPKPLVRTNQKISKLPAPLSGFFFGTITTLLPCVWLYGFVGMAASEVTLHEALMTIFVFWLGTIPALVITQHFVLKASAILMMRSRRLSFVLMLILSVLALWFHLPGGPSSCPHH